MQFPRHQQITVGSTIIALRSTVSGTDLFYVTRLPFLLLLRRERLFPHFRRRSSLSSSLLLIERPLSELLRLLLLARVLIGPIRHVMEAGQIPFILELGSLRSVLFLVMEQRSRPLLFRIIAILLTLLLDRPLLTRELRHPVMATYMTFLLIPRYRQTEVLLVLITLTTEAWQTSKDHRV